MKQNILVFRTSIKRKNDVKRVAGVLSKFKGIRDWSVDMEDWEKVLRIVCETSTPDEISAALRVVNIHVVELA
jgi:hypothetical protein